MSFLRRRKGSVNSEASNSEAQISGHDDKKEKVIEAEKLKGKRNEEGKINRWSCIDSCCWFIGFICSVWWFLLFLYNAMPASFPQYVTEVITGPLPDPPGVKLRKEGLMVKHPVVFVPGIVTGGLELWEGRQCTEGLFRKRLWGGTFGELYKRPLCWVEHMSLDNETGLDQPGIRVRPVSGLVAADYFAPGYFVWAVLIANLARIGYEEKTMYMAAYDWRISFQNTEVRDQSLSRIKSNIELMVATNDGKKVVVIPHSMGVLYFLHFMKWVEAPAPMGGGGGFRLVCQAYKSCHEYWWTLSRCPKVSSWTFLY
ncbi:Phospholipid:diacylglycerol acyltransferase 1 [Quillaja saponaria]|uniref:Phospholipid:diacylglycerol acyltransferase 1 n=1 Tax=Quillaja saponaria TaxID=32244 RepID=A0AAD7QD08_QUISA|nr:Phospholipid:diacylglycerol acyltransferase 1 [Quillaja saponaria]